MITHFNSIDVGIQLGCFNTLATDCIKLAAQYGCVVHWKFNRVSLEVKSWHEVSDLWKIYNEEIK